MAKKPYSEKELTKEEILKKEILNQYKSIRQFALEIGMPYSSLMSALEKGISGMAYDTVLNMCLRLGISPIDFSKKDVSEITNADELSEHSKRLVSYYSKLNVDGKRRLIELAEDFTELKRYAE